MTDNNNDILNNLANLTLEQETTATNTFIQTTNQNREKFEEYLKELQAAAAKIGSLMSSSTTEQDEAYFIKRIVEVGVNDIPLRWIGTLIGRETIGAAMEEDRQAEENKIVEEEPEQIAVIEQNQN